MRCSIRNTRLDFGLLLISASTVGCGIPVRIVYHDVALEAKWEREFSTRPLDPVEGFWEEKTTYGEGIGVTYRVDPTTNSGFPYASQCISFNARVPLIYGAALSRMQDRVGGRLKPTEDPRVYSGETLMFSPVGGEFWLPVTLTLVDPITCDGVIHTAEPVMGGNRRRVNLVGPKKELKSRLAAIAAVRAGTTTQPASQPTLVGGTGFLVSSSLVVTNQHVIAFAKSVRCFVGGDQVPAHVIAHDDRNDLAILRMDRPGAGKTVTLRIGDSSRARIGERVFSLGYPMTDVLGTDIKLHTGVISSLSGVRGTTGEFQLEMSINPGDSGGPVFDESGSVIGVMVSKIGIDYTRRTGDIAGDIAFAIKSEFIRSIANAAGISGEMTADPPTTAHTRLDEMVDLLREAVVRIEVER